MEKNASCFIAREQSIEKKITYFNFNAIERVSITGCTWQQKQIKSIDFDLCYRYGSVAHKYVTFCLTSMKKIDLQIQNEIVVQLPLHFNIIFNVSQMRKDSGMKSPCDEDLLSNRPTFS